MIRVLIVDDHPVFREGIKTVLAAARDMKVVAEAGDGRQALRLGSERDCNLVLLDLALPDMSGLEVLRALKADKPDRPVLVLSMQDELPYALLTLREGASGYLVKGSAADEIVGAVRKVARGRRYVSEALASTLAEREARPGCATRPLHEALSSREFQVFMLLAAGTPSKEIAARLEVARTTIASYRTRILEKMGMARNSDLVRYALKNGLTA
jgi:two-component system, NarL family, invasion response regulator UvrY